MVESSRALNTVANACQSNLSLAGKMPYKHKGQHTLAFVLVRRRQLYVSSRTSVVGPFRLTDSMPFSIADADEYISLRPIVSPLAAFRTK